MRLRIAAPLALSLVLPIAACDTKPNADFEKNFTEAKQRQAGDKFASLDNSRGRLTYYLQADPDTQISYLSSFGSAAASNVTNAMATLGELPIGDHAAVAAQCKSAIDAALTFKNQPPAEAELVSTAKARATALDACRRSANEAEDGEGAEVKEALQGWRRTASTAMMTLGTTLVERGKRDDGVALWREADKAMIADRPGRRLQPTDFYYSMR